MEHKHKLLAAENFEGDGPCTVNMIDRFSSLPKEIFHYILSKFAIENLVRFCCVSKAWRELCLSTPSLGFHLYCVDESKLTCELRLNLVNALDRFFLMRGHNKMVNFSLSWTGHSEFDMDDPCFCVNEYFRVITWIQNAVMCKVEKLYLDVAFFDNEEEPLAFPSCVFDCASLRSLVVEMQHTIVKTPSFTVSSKLERLALTDVLIKDEGFFKWISSCCNFLKHLTLAPVRGVDNITIESSSLEIFYFIDYELDENCRINISGQKLEEITIDCSHSSGSVVLNIGAPNVKNLLLQGKVKNHFNLGKLECLEQAAILMEPPIVDNFDKVREVLCSLSSVEVLVLNDAFIKAVYSEEPLKAKLGEIWYLQMNIGSFTDELVLAVSSLLRGTPNLSTLYMHYKPTSVDPKPDTSGFDVDYWKKQNLEFIHQVEDVTIELSAGSNGLELARYILEHAETLEKMVIRYLPEQSNAIGKLIESKMISNPSVIFEEYEGSANKLF